MTSRSSRVKSRDLVNFKRSPRFIRTFTRRRSESESSATGSANSPLVRFAADGKVPFPHSPQTLTRLRGTKRSYPLFDPALPRRRNVMFRQTGPRVILDANILISVTYYKAHLPYPPIGYTFMVLLSAESPGWTTSAVPISDSCQWRVRRRESTKERIPRRETERDREKPRGTLQLANDVHDPGPMI